MTWPAFSLGVWGYPDGMNPRVPPGQFVTERFPILTYGETPRIAKEAWRLEVTGLVETPLVLTYEDLLARPQVELTRDFHCVTRWSRLDVTWKGVRTRDLLEEARPRPEAVAALVESYGGYTTNLLLEDLLREDVLLAHTLFGKPLPPERGGPVRLLVPHLYAWKSAKWVRRIVLLDHLELGFWERLGYHWRGDPWKEERFQEGPVPAHRIRFAARNKPER
ncbi:sulfite oxidase-like oxidoreductase [Thermus thermophilus]|uniref:Sulfite oxidase-like oxidoreductase n=2 Tax=Thermus thermophilus TaxID=274 RepID=H9ZNR2_THETH|nr:sulfite oxidase-like oxidoreductase [Thermus thermophilus]AFH37972.1 sulfite oxidase-like oxidoreductase [Thermus thermophilus JL-18]